MDICASTCAQSSARFVLCLLHSVRHAGHFRLGTGACPQVREPPSTPACWAGVSPLRTCSASRLLPGAQVEADTVIVATGAVARRLEFPGSGECEGGYWNKGISACAVCDGAAPIFRNKPLAVIGGGDTAMEEAGYLTKARAKAASTPCPDLGPSSPALHCPSLPRPGAQYGSKVYIIHRRDEFRASKIMQTRALANHKIEASCPPGSLGPPAGGAIFSPVAARCSSLAGAASDDGSGTVVQVIWDSVVEAAMGDGSKLGSISVKNLKTGATSELEARRRCGLSPLLKQRHADTLRCVRSGLQTSEGKGRSRRAGKR